MDEEQIINTIQAAVRLDEILISLHAAEKAVVEEITKNNIVVITLYEPYPPKWQTPTQSGKKS